ncbi:glycosyl transferase [Peribacillus butanolivorans]|uniref:glycosyltransferase family 4 protein n=1 Tax=Peribacillus butanolivorans TaxID=421767 RepID=UPI0006A6C35D|nr:glycosyltransferase family 4 protein [Peribacillus butanolivorans]KON70201.1 glycosyl transferase [Peribacillus butanolivorans]
MKVIMIGSHLRVNGGITRVVKNYLESGMQKKVNLEYFPTYYGSNHFINILYFVIQYFKLFINLNLLNKQYDVAHIHMSYRGSYVRKRYIIHLLNSKNIPIVLHMHGSQFKDFYNESSNGQQKQIKDTLNKVSLILALGEQWKEYYQSISKTKVVSLDNAVFPKEILKSSEEKIYITTMGVLSQRKGTYDLIETASQIKGKINSKYKFLIAGDGEIDKVKKRIKELNVEDMFVIPGWISDQKVIDEIYRKSVIYVLPSYNEGMPMSILEAMSYGLPVVSTDVGSISSVVKEENGFVIKPGDVETLTNCLINLLNDQFSIEKFERNNSEKIRLEYNIYVSVEKIVELYKELLKG